MIEKAIKGHPAYGIRRLQAELEEEYQVSIGRDTLGKLLKLWGLSLARNIKKKKISPIQKILQALSSRANLLIRTKLNRPLQAITSDMTELNFEAGKAYLCIHKDAFGQMVYGWSLGLTMEAKLVTSSFTKAMQTMKQLTLQNPALSIAKPLFHQDRGSQYTSYEYVQTALACGTLSYSDPGTPTHNPGQESFFGRFKDEYKDEIAHIKTFEELERFIKAKIKYYNYSRRHTSIGLIAPYKFTKQFVKPKCKWYSFFRT